MLTVNLYDAKTHLSQLVERAAAGEEIVIAKNGIARARLVAVTAPSRAAKTPRSREAAADFDTAGVTTT
jgi:prevent-host-death family protein